MGRRATARGRGAERSVVALVLILGVAVAEPASLKHPVISQIYGGGGNSGAAFTHDYITDSTAIRVSVTAARCARRRRGAARVHRGLAAVLAPAAREDRRSRGLGDADFAEGAPGPATHNAAALPLLRAAWPAGAPPGAHTFAVVAIGPGGLTDGAVDPGDVLAVAGATLTVSP